MGYSAVTRSQSSRVKGGLIHSIPISLPSEREEISTYRSTLGPIRDRPPKGGWWLLTQERLRCMEVYSLPLLSVVVGESSSDLRLSFPYLSFRFDSIRFDLIEGWPLAFQAFSLSLASSTDTLRREETNQPTLTTTNTKENNKRQEKGDEEDTYSTRQRENGIASLQVSWRI